MSETIDMRPADKPWFPRHLRDDLFRLWCLRGWANNTVALWGEPLYLVGSALRENNPEPRDWDVRMMLPDPYFYTKFGSVKRWMEERDHGALFSEVSWRWSADMVKASRHGMRYTKLNIDFQVFPEVLWEKFKLIPKARLDTRDDDLLSLEWEI